jgi:hypothetical protein
MSLTEIKNNVDDLEKKSKEELINYIRELLIHEKKQESKNLTLQTELKYLKRNLTKIKDLIQKTIEANTKITGRWEKNG